MKKTIALLLVLLPVISLFAQSAPAGKYIMTSMMVEDTELLDAFRAMGMNTDGSYIELLSGGKFRMVMLGDENEAVGSFRVSGDEIIFFSGDEDLRGKIQGSRITIEGEDSRMVFEKK